MSRSKVFARTVKGDWISHPSLAFADWRYAVAVQRYLEDARIAGRLPQIATVVVRDEADPDPRYAHALTDLVPFFLGRLRGTSKKESAIKQVANGVYFGLSGGWIYREDQRFGKRRPVCQGWTSLDHQRGYSRKGQIVMAYVPSTRYGNGFQEPRYFVNDLLTLDADTVLGGPLHETSEV